ncbi:hypothetical protein MPLSOD_260006 [Mesorhizobium sp. SOD10]|nr:hypothetical protein MPLSOD_260006 [Mesorhizobium sp. SOD10]
MTVDADVTVLAGVPFMAETAKLLNPHKTVLIPDSAADCSLADSITAEDVRPTRQRYPGVSGHHLRQHLCSREGRVRHLLHFWQCARRREVPQSAAGDHAARRLAQRCSLDLR